MSRLSGKVAVVTGASCGIGLAVARSLVREGMKVAGLARRKQKMEEEMRDAEGGGSFFPVECDVADPRSVAAAFEWVLENLKVVHVLINNAGVVHNECIVDSSREVWEKIFDTNVMGLLECTKRAVKIMREADVEGCIININSVQGHRVQLHGGLPPNVYPASKFAVTGITETLQKELCNEKIRISSISPGYVHTDIFKDKMDHDILKTFQGMKSQDVADAVLYVLSTDPLVQVNELILTTRGTV